jgi:hypothetical protein
VDFVERSFRCVATTPDERLTLDPRTTAKKIGVPAGKAHIGHRPARPRANADTSPASAVHPLLDSPATATKYFDTALKCQLPYTGVNWETGEKFPVHKLLKQKVIHITLLLLLRSC